ncbi:Polyribonucleotide nucleotidyltransferase [Parasponia andersonii]|uniref:Polyribonucleotide nucleotidyltransferase n=1 Tax=Parasponia andersonii TaxID=3476 RepID=A0A2P5D518_PARAD|nr:Polyribonucleotide nucleotidyltransferase [Parasponia andersonii]
MSVSLTPSKRQHDGNLTELGGKGKMQKSTGSNAQSAVFRVLCPASKTESLIGKDGYVISQIGEDTGAQIRVKETIPGCDERVIVIGLEKEDEVCTEQNKEDEVDSEEANVGAKHDETKEETENVEDKESISVENSKPEKGIPSLQKALSFIFERMVEGHPETDGGNEESKKSSPFVLRLLVLSTQVGCILGKGGSVIKQMSSESGAQIRILPRDKLPPCATALDELVQITGDVDSVRKALHSVSLQLLENSPRDHDAFPANPIGPSTHLYGQPRPRPETFPPSSRSFVAQGAPYVDGPPDVVDYHSAPPPHIPKFHEVGIHGRMKPSLEILTFRLLCPAERVGGVIGKGGIVIKTVQQDTGCEVKVMEGVSDSEDRVIAVSGPVHPDDRVSAVQDAALRVQTRIVRAAPDSKEQGVTARILVSSNQIGCLLGKGGSIIAEMRKLSRAHIRILGKDQIPKCASEDEEVVQSKDINAYYGLLNIRNDDYASFVEAGVDYNGIVNEMCTPCCLINGEFEAVQDALIQITTRLQHHFFRDAFPSINYPPNPAFLDQPPFLSYLGRRELSPPGMYSNYGPSFHKFNAIGALPPHGGFHPRDDHPPFMHNIHRFGGPTHIFERRPWGPRALLEGDGPGLPDFAGIPQRRGNQPAIITSTTVEVVVPRSVVPVIYGEDGECLKQIRQISDAKITITEPKPGAVETVIIISGTPEQTHAAQSLIQAFVMSETESA